MSQPRKLTKQERHQRILDESRASAFVRISALAEHLAVSTETVRRDLDELCGAGLIDRTYGGATTPCLSVRAANGQAASEEDDEAAAIGAAAAQRVQAGQTVMLSGGSIVLHAAGELARTSVNLLVVTCNARVASVVAKNPAIQSVLSPGTYDAKEDGVTGEDAVGYLQQFNADIAIVEAGALTKEGPFEDSSAAATVKRAMLRQASTKILVARKAMHSCRPVRKVCTLETIDEVITYGRPDRAIVTAARKAGTRLSIISSNRV